jgi:probable HAF family extracellular repeat protein
MDTTARAARARRRATEKGFHVTETATLTESTDQRGRAPARGLSRWGVASSVLLGGAALLLAAQPEAARAQHYTYTDVSALVGSISSANLNNRGELAIDSGSGPGYLYRSGIGALTPLPFRPIDINDRGQILGSDGGTFILTGNTKNYLLLFGQTVNWGEYLNNNGDVAGNSGIGAELWRSDGTKVAMTPKLGGDPNNFVRGLDDFGNMVGDSNAGAWFYSSSVNFANVLATNCFVSAMSAGGGFTGMLGNGFTYHAFVNGPGFLEDIGVLDANSDFSAGNGVNDLGQVVGYSSVFVDPNATNSVNHAFLYSGGTMQDLTTLVPQLADFGDTQGLQINDRGQIFGSGVRDRQTTYFLLTPASAAPEPGALALFGAVGLPAGLAAVRRRRSRLTR